MRRVLRQALLSRQFSTVRGGKQVGFIGLGNMGVGMTANLKEGGFEVKGYDIMPETRQKFRDEGFDVVESVQELLQNQEIDQIIVMVPAAQHVRDLCEGDNGIFKNAKKGLQVIDCSTIGPTSALDLYKSAKENGVEFIDAPVSGGTTGAAAGTLTFMVGTQSKDQFNVIKPTLEPMAKNVFDCAQPAGGQITKAANNMALAIQMTSISEALSLGKKLGMDTKVLSEIMSTATASCWSLNAYNPAPGVLEGLPSGRNYEGGFACELMVKDLGLAQEAVEAVGASTPLGKHVTEIYKQLVNENGCEGKDFSIIYDQILNNKV